MRAGRLRRRVTIQTQSSTVDSHGEQVDTWTNTDTVWAAVEDLTAREAIRDTAFTESITTNVTLRSRTPIETGQRIVVGTRTLEIAAPPFDPEGRGREITLLCREVTP